MKQLSLIAIASILSSTVLFGADEPKKGARGTPEEMFKKWDENGDGKLSMAEYVGKKTASEDEAEFKKFDKELVISFRGTNAIDIPNWSMNFKSEKVPYEDVEGAQIHAGWYIGWKNLRDDTLAKVADMIWKYQPKKILLTGHSLGGALATLAAIEIKLHSGFMGDIQLYTYG